MQTPGNRTSGAGISAGINTRRFIIPSLLTAACLVLSSAPVMPASASEGEFLLAMSKNKRTVEENREGTGTHADTGMDQDDTRGEPIPADTGISGPASGAGPAPGFGTSNPGPGPTGTGTGSGSQPIP